MKAIIMCYFLRPPPVVKFAEKVVAFVWSKFATELTPNRANVSYMPSVGKNASSLNSSGYPVGIVGRRRRIGALSGPQPRRLSSPARKRKRHPLRAALSPVADLRRRHRHRQCQRSHRDTWLVGLWRARYKPANELS